MYKKKKEFSKVVVTVANILVWILTITNVVYMFLAQDSSTMTYLIPSLFTLVTTTNASYYWKAKNENEIKLNSYYESGGYDE